MRALRDAGLDSIQLSFQSDESSLADEIAGARAHERKLDVAAKIRAAGIPLSLNFVIHRRNIDRLPQMIDLTEALGAERVELANVQFYGWAFRNRAALLPTREQVDRARDIATAAKARLAGKIDIFYVLPDYYETRPKPCLNGWGQRYLTVNPIGDVLPCPTASIGHSRFAFRKCPNTRSRLDLARIRKFQPIPWNGMDAGAVPELSAKRNRFRRLPLSGRVADRKCREHRSGLRILAKSRDRGRCAARHKFIEQQRERLDISHEPERVAYFRLACVFGELLCHRLQDNRSTNGETRCPQRVARNNSALQMATAKGAALAGYSVGLGTGVGRGLVSHAISEWALVSVLPWQLGSMLACQSRWLLV